MIQAIRHEKNKPKAADDSSNVTREETGGRKKPHQTIHLTVFPNWLNDLRYVRRRLAAPIPFYMQKGDT
jgi:hypothetical protein